MREKELRLALICYGGVSLAVYMHGITGGINAVFLAQAIHSGQSLDPLTDLWLDNADVDRLLDPEAQLWTWVAKFWAPPVVELLLSRPGNVVAESVAPGMRAEVRRKLARFVRSRWFQPPFSGIGFSRLLADALQAMEDAPVARRCCRPAIRWIFS